MALYKDKNGNLHDDMGGAARALFPIDLAPYIQVTDAEASAIRALIVPIVSLKEQARLALLATDVTMLRCIESGVAVPLEWNSYRKKLRAIYTGVDTVSTALPARPPYPAGT